MKKDLKNYLLLALFVVCLGNVFAQENETIPPKDSVFPKISYDWISYQMKVSIDKKEEQLAFQCFLVNRIDSAIYLNLNRSGIELARVVLTPDSVKFVNKLEHTYYVGSYLFLEKMFGFPLDFFMVQSLLNGVDFKDFDDGFTRVEEDGKLFYVAPQRSNSKKTLSLMQSIEIGEGGVIVDNDITDLRSMRDVDFSYKNYSDFGEFHFFTKFEVEMEMDEVEMEVEMKNIKFNQSGPVAIRIPENFSEIEIRK